MYTIIIGAFWMFLGAITSFVFPDAAVRVCLLGILNAAWFIAMKED